MAFFASQYIANCFRDPQAFAVASTVARASLSSDGFPYEQAIAKAFYGTLGGAASVSLAGVPTLLWAEPQAPTGPLARLWSRITNIVSGVTTSLSAWLNLHSHVVVWIAGLAFVVIGGAIVYFTWIAPQLSGPNGPLDAQDSKVMQSMADKPRERLLQQTNDLAAKFTELATLTPVLPLCQVCKEAPPNFACTGCGNLVLCKEHIEAYKSTFGTRCPVCRKTEISFLQIKLPGTPDSSHKKSIANTGTIAK